MNKSKGSVKRSKAAEELDKTISKYKTVAVVELSGFPSDNFEQVRKLFRGQAHFVYTNKVVIYNALKNQHPHLAGEIKNVRMPVLMLSNEDPFEIARIAVDNKAYTKLKAGEAAPEDIVLPSGPTPFPPGPMLSQFSSIGVKTKNEGGKIAIVADTVVVRKGEAVQEKTASILSSMEIKPKELMLSVRYALNGGLVFPASLLYRSRDEYAEAVRQTFSRSLALSVGRGILNRYSVKSVIKKIYIGVRFLSVDRNIVSKSTIKDILVKAAVQANALTKISGGK